MVHSISSINTSLSFQLLQVYQLLFTGFSKTDELTTGWLQLLMLIDTHPSLNQSQLARTMHVEPPTIVNKIDQLEKRGWLRRARSRTDRRTHTLFLTRLGREVLLRAKANLDEHEQRLTRDLTADEKAALLALLQRVGI